MNILKLCLREVGEGAHFKSYYCLGGCNFHMNFFFWGGRGSEVQGSTSYSENPYTPLGHTKQSLPFLHYAFKALGDSGV